MSRRDIGRVAAEGRGLVFFMREKTLDSEIQVIRATRRLGKDKTVLCMRNAFILCDGARPTVAISWRKPVTVKCDPQGPGEGALK